MAESLPDELNEELDTDENREERRKARKELQVALFKNTLEASNTAAAATLRSKELEDTLKRHQEDWNRREKILIDKEQNMVEKYMQLQSRQVDIASDTTTTAISSTSTNNPRGSNTTSRRQLFESPSITTSSPPVPSPSVPSSSISSPSSDINKSKNPVHMSKIKSPKNPTFNPATDVWEIYEQRFLDYSSKLDDNDKILLLADTLLSEAKQFNSKLKCPTFDERFAILKALYSMDENTKSVLTEKFLDRKQEPEESVKKYVSAKIELAYASGMDEKATITNIILKMNSDIQNVFHKHCTEVPVSYKQLIEGARLVDADPYARIIINNMKKRPVTTPADIHLVVEETIRKTNAYNRDRELQLELEYENEREHEQKDKKRDYNDYYKKDKKEKYDQKRSQGKKPDTKRQKVEKYCNYCKKSNHATENCFHWLRFKKFANENEKLPNVEDRINWPNVSDKNPPSINLTYQRETERRKDSSQQFYSTSKLSTLFYNNHNNFDNKDNTYVFSVKALNKCKCLTTEGTVGGVKTKIIIDTGSPVSIIGSKVWENIKDKIPALKSIQTKVRLAAANGNILHTLGTIDLLLDMYGMSRKNEFIICPELNDKVILGMDTLIDWRMELLLPKGIIQCMFRDGIRAIIPVEIEQKETMDIDIRNVNKIHIKPHTMVWIQATVDADVNEVFMVTPNKYSLSPGRVIVANTVATVEKDKTIWVPVMNFTKNYITLKPGAKIPANITAEKGMFSVEVDLDTSDKEESQNIPIDNSLIIEQINKLDLATDTDLTVEQQHELRQLLLKNADIFAVDSKAPGLQINVKHYIDTGNHPPVHTKPWRLSQHEKEVIAKEVITMLKNGIIRKSKSPWNASVVLAGKKDGTLRFCVDYRKLNQITKRDVYPLPRIDDMLEKFREMCYFSTFDFASGYWQVEINESDKEKTAFTTSDGLFEWNVMPFGLTNAPATFQRMMNEVIANIDWETGGIYLDDLFTAAKSFKRHISDLEKVFDRIHEAGLHMKLSKCKFARNTLIYLGHKLSKQGIEPEPSKISAIQNIKLPTSIKEVRQFLGLTGYYRKFIKNYAAISHPLNHLLLRGTNFQWIPECQNAFNILKQKLIEASILRYPNWDKPFFILTDASYIGLGAVLSQKDDNNQEYVVAYASRALTKDEKKYTTATEVEALALSWALQHYRPYIHGKQFEVFTDHKALEFIQNSSSVNGRVARWSFKIQAYQPWMKISYRKGKSNANADALSRLVSQEVNFFQTDIDHTEWTKELHSDERTKYIMEYLETGTCIDLNKLEQVTKMAPWFDVIDGKLYRLIARKVGKEPEEISLRLVPPASKIKDILYDNHDNPNAGHLGIKKTYSRIASQYYWPGLYTDVQMYVKSCTSCQTKKGDMHKRMETPLQIAVTGPSQIVAMDFLGPLTLSGKHNQYILVITDLFSKFVEAFATQVATAQLAAQILADEWICRHGAPKTVLTDRGSTFVADLTQDLLNIHQIKGVTTTAYHQQANGQCERFNKTLCNMLAMYVDEEQKNWDIYLKKVVSAYNLSIHETTKDTPFKLHYGRDPRIPSGLMDHLDDDDPMQDSYQEYNWKMRLALERIYAPARRNMDLAKMNREKMRLKNAMEHNFKAEDLVWLYIPHKEKGLSSKLSHPWQGPFRIVEFVNPVNVKLASIGSVKVEQVVHVKRLKPYTAKQKPNSNQTISLDADDNFDFDKEDPKVTDTAGSITKEIRLKAKQRRQTKKKPTIINEDANQSDKAIIANNDNLIDHINPNSPMVIDKPSQEITGSSGKELSEMSFEVVKLHDLRVRNHTLEYLVEFKDNPVPHWEPEDALNCPELQKKLHASRGTWCPICDKLTVHKSQLKEHMRLVHKKNADLNKNRKKKDKAEKSAEEVFTIHHINGIQHDRNYDRHEFLIIPLK